MFVSVCQRKFAVLKNPEACQTFNSDDGARSDLSGKESFDTGAGSQDLSVPVAGNEDRAAEPGLEHGHHVLPPAGRIRLSDGGTRLVQPVRHRLRTVGEPRCGVLRQRS